ncbi:F-box only protein 33-like [Oppia nitens]|uniref:F-box only protein 33-like n=1 Tax=Oppia nitens TaxID=1686743 RepID=UPI0023DAD65B|nr:F-box only protein 33-like [Oppia nitens]
MAFVCNYLPSVIILNILSYLSPKDRLRASSTCKTWRQCLLAPSQWPYKRLTVDLYRISGQSLRRNRYHNKSCDDSIALKSFLYKCCRFLTDLTITFDPNSPSNVHHLIGLIDILLANNADHFIITDGSNDQNVNNNNTNNNYSTLLDNQWVSNSRCLRRFTLNPIAINKTLDYLNNENNAKMCQLFQQLVQRLEQLIDKCDFLEHISFGCLQQVLNHSNRLLLTLAKHHSQSLKCLHLSSVKANPDYYPVFELSINLLEPFSILKVLSIDFDIVSDQLLQLMARKTTIDTFIVNVHGIDDEHKGLTKSSWSLLVQNNCNLKVTLNLIHTDDSLDVLRDSLLDTDMPLAHFRAYFVGMFGATDNTICHLVNLVANRHSKTLQSMTLMTTMSGPALEPNPVFADLQENPLVMLAWRSKQLHSLTIIGYEVCDADLIAITRLRGTSLKNFMFPLCCISLLHSPIAEDEGYYDDYFDRRIAYLLDGAPQHIQTKVIEDIAQPLNRKWTPMTFDQLPNALINGCNSLQTTYLSTILRDQTLCDESHNKTSDTN